MANKEVEVVFVPVKATTESLDAEVIRDILKTDFLKRLKDNNIDIDLIINEKKKDNTSFHKFNYLIKDLHKSGEVDMCDALTYLEDNFKYKEILKCLNSENMLFIRALMTERFKIKSKIASIKVMDL